MRALIVRATDNELMFVEMPEPEARTEWLQATVGGWFECVYLPGPNVDLWINEEGKYLDIGNNEWATAACFHGGPVLSAFDFIRGNVVVTGTANGQGEMTGLTNEQMDWLRKKVVI
jgi:hypothetical protein